MQYPRSIFPVALFRGRIGGGVAIGAVTALALGGSNTKTVVQQAPLATADASQKAAGLTPRDIYERDAPGVAYITAQIVQRTASPFNFGLPQEQQGTST